MKFMCGKFSKFFKNLFYAIYSTPIIKLELWLLFLFMIKAGVNSAEN